MTLLTFNSDFHSASEKGLSGSRTRKTIVGWDFHNFHHSTTSERENWRPEKVCSLRFPAAEKLHLWTTFHSGYQQKTVKIFSIIFPFLSIHQSSPLFCVARLQCSSWRKLSHKKDGKLIEDYDERNMKRWALSIHSICVSPSRVWNFWNEINVFPQVFPAYSPLSRRLFAINVDISSRVFICSKA